MVEFEGSDYYLGTFGSGIASKRMVEKSKALKSARQDVALGTMRVVRLKHLLAASSSGDANAAYVKRKLSLAEIQLAEQTAWLEAMTAGALQSGVCLSKPRDAFISVGRGGNVLPPPFKDRIASQ